MEHHQRSGIGNTTIMQYMLDWFRLPTSFEMTLWTSQILQGMAIKYACEHWRRSMPRGMGTLYWQLNDVWPVASWASIDYHGRWKALHYMARNFFAPVLLSGLEDKEKGTVELHVTSDLLIAKSCTVRWNVTDAAGQNLLSGSKAIRTPVNSNRKVATLKLASLLQKHSERDLIVWLELEMSGEPLQRNLVLFARPKHLALSEKPAVGTNVADNGDGTFSVTLSAKRAALWVWLGSSKVDLCCSDNFVHLCPKRPLTVKVKPSKTIGYDDFCASLQIHSLVDTFSA
jgi:beta-mannosidase